MHQPEILTGFVADNAQFLPERLPFQTDKGDAKQTTPEPPPLSVSPPELSDVHKQRLRLLEKRCAQLQSRLYNTTADVSTNRNICSL